ncbi:Type I restriction-modification system, specificity subunit S [Sphingobacterium sp. JB170]|nr:Type I restriction-modification system, specificity subunit S [Sphingobacterium sp. JB170]
MNILLIVPSLPKQEAIVLYLDEVTTKIDQAITQKQIIQLKEYKQSLINNVVTGKVRVAS